MSVMAQVVSGGLISASAVVKNSPTSLVGFTALTDGTNDATVTIYDHASSASGTVLGKLVVAGADRSRHIEFASHRLAVQGLYASISGVGASCVVYYI